MKVWQSSPPSTRVIAIYASVFSGWAAFAFWAAPEILTSAYLRGNLPVLDLIFEAYRAMPLAYCLNSWRLFASTALIAITLHLFIVLFIMRANRIHPRSISQSHKLSANGTAVLAVFSGIFLAATVITGITGDYTAYNQEWHSILAGKNPWALVSYPYNVYGPLFNVLALPTLLSPIANKLVFSSSYLVYVVWLMKVFLPEQGHRPVSWFWFGLLILNPFPWEQISYLGYFDILVGISCVASIHSLVCRRDGRSGMYLSLGILLKFMPVMILPFLAFNRRRFNWKFVAVCIAVIGVGFFLSDLLWGPSAFTPLAFAATRVPQWSIYTVVDRWTSSSNIHIVFLEKPILIFALVSVFTWYELRNIDILLSSTIAMLVTLLLYRVEYANYQMVLFCLVTYLAAANWPRLQREPLLSVLLIAYFIFMAVAGFDLWAENDWRGLLHPNVVVLLQFLFGCLLLAGLVRFSIVPASAERG